MLRRAAIVLMCAHGLAAPAAGAALLRGADVRIVFTSPTECEVTMSLTVEGASEIEHRVDAHDSGIEFIGLQGARQAGEIHSLGRTRVLRAQPQQPSYAYRYRARLSADRAHRCPVWLPTAPADGQSRAVALHVEIPEGASAGRSMPPLSWTGSRGTSTLGHLPAFVHVPFGAAGGTPAWAMGEVMDVLAVTVFAAATAAWMWTRRRTALRSESR